MKFLFVIRFLACFSSFVAQKSEFELSNDCKTGFSFGFGFNQKADLLSSGLNLFYQTKPKHALEIYTGLLVSSNIDPKNSEIGVNYFYFPNENTKRLNLLFQLGTHYSGYSEKIASGLGFDIETRYTYFGLNSGFGFQWNLSQHLFTKMYFSGGYNFTNEATWYQNFDLSIAYRIKSVKK